MSNKKHKLITSGVSILLFMFFLFSFSIRNIAFAEDTTKHPREDNIDLGMLLYWMGYGDIVSGTDAEELKYLGTSFTANPVKTAEMVDALALQWVFGVEPVPGEENYSTSLVQDMMDAGYFDQAQADYLKSAGEATLSLPTTFEPLPDNMKSKSSAEKGEINDMTDLPGIILSGANRGGTDANLLSLALARSDNLAAAVPEKGTMLPEQKGTKDIGKNTGTSYTGDVNGNSSVAGASFGPGGNSTSANPRVLPASTGPNGSANENVWVKAFAGKLGNIIKPTVVQNSLSDLLLRLPAMMVTANPSGTDIAVNPGKMPSNIAGTDAQKKVTSTGVTGDSSFVGKNNEIAQNGAPPKTNANDLANIAARRSADQINNRMNQIDNQQNYLNNNSNLQQQFPPDQLNNLLDNKFPSDGSGDSTTPPVTPITLDTSICDPAKAVLSQQEVVSVADLMGLALAETQWKISYFLASELQDPDPSSLYSSDSNIKSAVDSAVSANRNSCIWVVYAETAKEGAYVTDARNQTGIKFLFRMP